MEEELKKLYDEELTRFEKIQYVLIHLFNFKPRCEYCNSRKIKPFKRVVKEEPKPVPGGTKDLDIIVKDWYLFYKCTKCNYERAYCGEEFTAKNSLNPFIDPMPF